MFHPDGLMRSPDWSLLNFVTFQIALIANIRLNSKGLRKTNTLAYFAFNNEGAMTLSITTFSITALSIYIQHNSIEFH